MRRTPALIVGGGPAGAALAMRLAREGAPHLLLERQRETGDALCGGFLSWRTLENLAGLGVGPERLGGHPVRSLRLFAGSARAEAPLPRPAMALSRRRLDSVLLAHAEAGGAAVERGVHVREAGAGRVRLADGATMETDALFLATGKHELRGLPRSARAAKNPTLGLRVRLGPAPGLTRLVGGSIELHLFAGGYAGLCLQEDGSANLCMALRRSRLTEAGSPERLLRQLAAESPALGERLAWWAGDRPDAVANVPYGWRARKSASGLFRLGDQAAVIPSLAGEGMGIALASGIAAATAYLSGGPGAAPGFQARFARSAAGPIALASTAWHLAEQPVLARAAVRAAAWAPQSLETIARLTRINHTPIDARAPAPQI